MVGISSETKFQFYDRPFWLSDFSKETTRDWCNRNCLARVSVGLFQILCENAYRPKIDYSFNALCAWIVYNYIFANSVSTDNVVILGEILKFGIRPDQMSMTAFVLHVENFPRIVPHFRTNGTDVVTLLKRRLNYYYFVFRCKKKARIILTRAMFSGSKMYLGSTLFRRS